MEAWDPGKKPALFFAWICLVFLFFSLKLCGAKCSNPGNLVFWEYCHCMPLSCLYDVEIGKSMTAGSLCFVEVVLISRVHGISWVLSSIGFRRDVRTKIVFTNSIDSISGPQGCMLFVDSARQKTSKRQY